MDNIQTSQPIQTPDIQSAFNVPYHTHNGIDSPLVEGSGALSKVRVHLGTTTTAIGAQQVSFDTIDFDTNKEFDTTTHQFTAKGSGYFRVYASAYFSGSSTGYQYALKIYKNNVEISESNRTRDTNDIFTIGVEDIVSLAIGDHLDIYAYTNALSSVNINQGSTITYLTIQQLS